MAYESGEDFNRRYDKIICDKCGTTSIAYGADRGRGFFNEGWTANFRAKKYVHICRDCQTRKQRKVTDWAISKFG